jgi:hypothetical protein
MPVKKGNAPDKQTNSLGGSQTYLLHHDPSPGDATSLSKYTSVGT